LSIVQQTLLIMIWEDAMGILLAFTPFIVFAVVATYVGAAAGLICAALIAAGLMARDGLILGKSPKILEIGTVILFTVLALLVVTGLGQWSVMGIRLRVDGGLLAIALASLALRRPFTLQYAREQTPQEIWNHPLFVRTNYIITSVWTLAFVVMVAADVLMLYRPDVPTYIGVVATVAALVGAFRFTAWYPQHLRARFAS
jgi:hypothetical protein